MEMGFSVQGHIWRKGFQSGELKSQLFPDVAGQLQQWHSQGIKVYIYSSGSREAQKSLLANTGSGDLRAHLCGFFDTTSGAKVGPTPVALPTYLLTAMKVLNSLHEDWQAEPFCALKSTESSTEFHHLCKSAVTTTTIYLALS